MDLEHRMDISDRRMARVERRLDGTLKLVKMGMKMLVQLERGLKAAQKETKEFKKETREAINALIEAQTRTETKIDRLVDGLLRRYPNGSQH